MWVLSLVDGYSDPFYLRFTTPKQHNLLLGTSRAAQGLVPAVFDEQLHKKFYNYSFTIGHSPYGPVYLESIKRKLDEDEKDGIFILAVDPWSISSTSVNPNDSTKFRELDRCLDNTKIVDMNPNFIYLRENFGGNYYKLLYPKKRSDKYSVFLHNDGWLEVTLPMDSAEVNRRVLKKMKIYRENNLKKFKYSSFRLNYLQKTIIFLRKQGKVYLVRLPVHPKMIKIENELMPNFEDLINEVVPLSNGYLNMTLENNLYMCTDGNHLYKESGKEASKNIAIWIKQQQQ